MEYVYEKKAKLVGSIKSGTLCLLNAHEDWIHDQYGDSCIYHGAIHSAGAPFNPLSTTITGYFQDTDTSKWIKVTGGVVKFADVELDNLWKIRLEELLKFRLVTTSGNKFRCRA